MTHHAPTRFSDLNIGDHFRWPNGKTEFEKITDNRYAEAGAKPGRPFLWGPSSTRVIPLERAS